jgi:hypothetical protein
MIRILMLFKAVILEIDLRDMFTFGGLFCASYGAHEIYSPLGWLVAGVALFWLGVRNIDSVAPRR